MHLHVYTISFSCRNEFRFVSNMNVHVLANVLGNVYNAVTLIGAHCCECLLFTPDDSAHTYAILGASVYICVCS